jgi:ATP-dependent DNA helicase RecG
MNHEELLQRLNIGENKDTEFKLADGGLPSIWETVSAFANTEGGYLILGVKEKDNNEFEVLGLKKPEALIKTFWDTHNNPSKLSARLCTDPDVQAVTFAGRRLVIIYVPRASREQRPIYINGNLLTGTYKRNHAGSYRCSEIEVRQINVNSSFWFY